MTSTECPFIACKCWHDKEESTQVRIRKTTVLIYQMQLTPCLIFQWFFSLLIIRLIFTTVSWGSYYILGPYQISDIKNNASDFSPTGLILTVGTTCLSLHSNFTAAPGREFPGLCSQDPFKTCCSTCLIRTLRAVSQALQETVAWTIDSDSRLDFIVRSAFCKEASSSGHKPSHKADVVITNSCS